jgi:hypothetical protein
MDDPVRRLGTWASRRKPELLAVCVMVLLLAPAFVGDGNTRQAAGEPVSEWARKGWWERAYFVTNALLPLAAMAAVLVALYQLNASRRGQKAEVYLEFDRRWGSLESWRTVFWQAVATQKSGGETVSAMLNRLYKAGAPWTEYNAMMQGAPFFESVAVMVRRGYVDKTDVIDLLGDVIKGAWKDMADHIDERRKPPPGQAKGNADIFVEFERLALEIEAFDTERGRSAHR